MDVSEIARNSTEIPSVTGASSKSTAKAVSDPTGSQLSESNDHNSNEASAVSLQASILTAHQNREHRLRAQRQRALKSVTKYNTFLNQQRVAERKNYFDLQTNLVHVPRRSVRVLAPNSELYQMQLVEARSGSGPFRRPGNLQGPAPNLFAKKTGAYPAALMFSPPQYSDSVPIFSPKELGYLPLTTTVHTAPPFAVHCLNLSAEEFRKMRGIDANGQISDADDSDLDEKDDIEMSDLTGSATNNAVHEGVLPFTPVKTIYDMKPESAITPTPAGRSRTLKKDVDTPSVVLSPEKEPVPPVAVLQLPIEIPPCPANTCFNCHTRAYQPPLPPAEVVKPAKKKRGKKKPAEPTAAELASETLIGCSNCTKLVHPSCMHLSKGTLFAIQTYQWQCTDCKVCLKCNSPAQEEKLMFCDFCDRGYHNFCVGVPRIPHGRWLCHGCAVCSLCGASRPNLEGKRGRACIWQPDWDEDAAGNVTTIRTLCYPCFKKKKGSSKGEEDDGEGDDDEEDSKAEAD
ncbi:putative PHD finger protein 10 [Hypsibius exemplaris]|uniref:PHD finger protein 10 n=1 Tax=Hypsibius exemplaris TaxID=2072580 RepID=A0A1W0XD59_HYPEX|nr:putative PHD finger protein 10 [Hypsibius exemplaris]